jgi:hypothetical protein
MSVQPHITIKTHNNQPYTIYHISYISCLVNHTLQSKHTTINHTIYHIPFIIQIISFLGCTSAFSRDFALLYFTLLYFTHSSHSYAIYFTFFSHILLLLVLVLLPLTDSEDPSTHRVCTCTCTWTPNCKTSSLPSPSIQFNPWFVPVPVWFRDSNLSDLTAASKQAPSPCTYLYLHQYLHQYQYQYQYQYRLGGIYVSINEFM